MSNTADDFYRAIMELEKMIQQEENDVDYLVIIDGMLLEEKPQLSTRFYNQEHRKIIRGIRKHTRASAKLQRRLTKYRRHYAKLKRREGW